MRVVDSGDGYGYELSLSDSPTYSCRLVDLVASDLYWSFNDGPYWVASPASNGKVYNANVYRWSIDTDPEAYSRPVVCLKDGVKIKKENGVYTLVQ